MKNYEILLIINQQFSDEEIPSVMENVFEVVKRNGGEVKEHKILGRNKLAYPIKHSKFGVYVLAQVGIDPLQMEKLSKEITMMPEILRSDVSNEISKGGFAWKTAGTETSEAKEQSAIAEPAVLEKVEDLMTESPENPEEAKAEQPVKPVVEKEKAEEEKKESNKISLDELDKKLDEILKEEII